MSCTVYVCIFTCNCAHSNLVPRGPTFVNDIIAQHTNVTSSTNLCNTKLCVYSQLLLLLHDTVGGGGLWEVI